jgi:hypothetical protein
MASSEKHVFGKLDDQERMRATRMERIRAARARARARVVQKIRGADKVCADSWSSMKVVLKEWTSFTSSQLKNMRCCAFCGSTYFQEKETLHNNRKSKWLGMTLVRACSLYAPYALANIFLAKHIVREGDAWLVCPSCKKKPARHLQFTVYMSPSYMVALFSVHPLLVQLLSVLDVNFHLLRKLHGFAHGRLETNSLLENPIITWNTRLAEGVHPSALPPVLFHLLRHNIMHNPVLREYQSILEMPHPKYCVPVLDANAICRNCSEPHRQGTH